MKSIFAALFFLFLPLGCWAATALSGDEVRLDDGRIVRLVGIKGDAMAKPVLQKMVDAGALTFTGTLIDRYGRIPGILWVDASKSPRTDIAVALVRQGVAFVYPPVGDEPNLQELLKAEREARDAHVGLWSTNAMADFDATKPGPMAYGRFLFVSGKVLNADRSKGKIFLNFGNESPYDFTIVIDATALKIFHQLGIDPSLYEGKIIRVRGLITRMGGPAIRITHPSQIEVL